MQRKRSPIIWFGGKGMMLAKLLPLLPSHKIYAEAFGGGGSMLFGKDPAPVEIYNDLNSGLVNFFRVLRDPDRAAKLHFLANATPMSREEYDHCRATWRQCEDDVERAYRWFVVARMSFAGRFGGSWGLSVASSNRGMAQSTSKWISTHAMLGEAHHRLMRVQIEHVDFRRFIEHYDSRETLFYLDPPYVLSTRKSGGYEHELTEEDHADLVKLVLNSQGMFLLSGYPNDLYKPLEKAGWQRREFETFCNSVGRTAAAGLKGTGVMREEHKRTECVWISPNVTARMKDSKQRKAAPKLIPAPHVTRWMGAAA